MTIFSISDADLLYLLIIYTNSKEVRIAERKKKDKNSHERKLQNKLEPCKITQLIYKKKQPCVRFLL